MIKEEQEAMAKQMLLTFCGAATAMIGGPPPAGAEGQQPVAVSSAASALSTMPSAAAK